MRIFLSFQSIFVIAILRNCYCKNCKRVAVFICLFIAHCSFAQTVYQHDFGTTDIDTYPYIVAPNTFDSHFRNSSWTNSTGTWTNFAGSSGQSIAFRPGVGNAVITLTFNVAQDYSLSITQFNFWSQRSSTGPTDWSMKINGTPIGSGTVSTTGTPVGNTNVSNVANGMTGNITLEITLIGATSGSGTFRLDDFTLIGFVSPVQTYYRSRQSGDWSSPSTWEYSPDNVNWNLSSVSPTKDAENILIQALHSVSVTDLVSLDQTTIAGILELRSGGVLDISDGEGDDITISTGGVLRIISTEDYSASIQQAATADINIASGGKIKIGDGTSSTGNGYEACATSTTNVWNDGSIYEYDIDKAFAAPGLIYFPNADENTIPIFRISAVNGTPGSGSSSDFHLNGILELNTDLNFKGTGNKYLRDGIKGNYSVSQENAGQICLNGLHPLLEGDSLKIDLSGNLKLYTDAEIPAGSYVMVSGSNLSNNVTDGTVFTINGTLDVTDQGVKNTHGSIILNGTFRTANTGGFSGSKSSIPSGGITVNSGSTVELYANGDQNINSDKFSNLILSGSGTKTPTGSFSPKGTVTIKDDAIFDCRGRNIGDETVSGPTVTNLTMSGNSRLIVDTYGPNPKMAGTYNLTGGVIEFNGSNGTTETIRSKNYQNIEVTGSNVGMSDGNISLHNNGTFTVKNGGVFSINDNTIIGTGDGTQTVVVESGGLFKCGTNEGFNGFTITPAPIKSSAINSDIQNIILEPNSTVEYSRSSPPLSDGDQPITNANGLIYQNIIISGSGNKTAPAGNLIIQGDLTKTGTAAFVHNNGTVIFNGIKEQIYSSDSPKMVFNNLRNENASGLTINGNLFVYNQLSLEDNSVINLHADLSLLSDKNQTAAIGQLNTNSSINYYEGRVIIQRYINTGSSAGSHQKSWQLLSTPVFGQTIHDSWQEGGSQTILGYGTWITSPQGVANGFDGSSLAPSMKYYEAKSGAWIGVSSTNVELAKEQGYMLFVRGDRQANSVNAIPTPTTLRIRGKLYSPVHVPPASSVPAGKFQCVGNPYAAPIDFEKINSSNIASSYYAWDPGLGGSYGYGGYQTISKATGYLPVPGGTSNYNDAGDYQFIQSGQAFFVTNYTSVDGSVSFAENCKAPGNNHLVTRQKGNEKSILFANLLSQTGGLIDGNAVSFSDDFSNRIDGDDVRKIAVPAESFTLKNSGERLVVEARNSIHSDDTLFYDLRKLRIQEYKLVFVPRKINTGLEAWLVDHFLHTEKQISLSDTSYLNFSVTSDKGSSDPGRFYMVFHAAAGPLAISVFSMAASERDENVLIVWKVENEKEIKNYEVQYSADGIHFTEIGVVHASNGHNKKYNFTHFKPARGNAFYRIKFNKINGESEYQKVVKVIIPPGVSTIRIYPNPLNGKVINLEFVQQPLGKYYFSLYNNFGQKVVFDEIIYGGGKNLSLKCPQTLPVGIYQLQIIKPNGQIESLKVKSE